MTSGQLHLHGAAGPLDMATSNQELLAKGNKKQRVVVVVLVVAVVMVLVGGVAVMIRHERLQEPRPLTYRFRGKSSVTLRDVVTGHLTPRRLNATWISDNELLYRRDDGGFRVYNARKRTSKLLLPADNDIIKNSFQYTLSADHRYLMLAHNFQKMYRHTFMAYYHIVDLETRKSWPLTDVNGSPMLVQLVTWSPVGSAFTYVYVNDIYYRTSAREQPVQEYRLTHNGRPGTIYNGIPDWVYEEEVFSSNSALWFSPDGRNIAFATFNDSQTPVMNIPYYGAPGDMRYQYSQAVNIRYPKPGRPNPTVSLNLVNLIELQYQKAIKTLDIPASPELSEPVLNMVSWTPTSELFVLWMNRVQNQAKGILCSPESTHCKLVLELEEQQGWVRFSKPLFSSDGGTMIYLAPQEQRGGVGNFMHAVALNLRQPGAKVQPLTSGQFVVSDLLSLDEELGNVYLTATAEGRPSQQQVLRVSTSGLQEPHCISCNHNSTCGYSTAQFSQKSSFYVLSCAGPSVPSVAIYSKEGKRIITWEDNKRLRNKLEGKVLPTVEYLTVPVSEDLNAYIKLYLPPDLDESGNTKYPMLVQVYGGPDSAQVFERFSIDWHSYLTVNRSIIYAMIDGRGSGLKGDKMLFSNYRNIGTLEVQDQIQVTRYLQESRSYIDSKRTAIWGWSYGGYVTGMVLANDTKGVFRCGMAVAPVTDWLLYDTIYTERYMGLPTVGDNLKGYERAALNNKVANLRKKQLLLVHGTLDDNVHYQQSMMLARALELSDILFQQLSYPDENHGLTDVRPHLYHSLGHFLDQCFQQPL